MDELEQRGRALMGNYEPQNAAMLRLMADTWQGQCFVRHPEQRLPGPMTIGQTVNQWFLTDCRNPPEDAFGKVYSLPTLFDEFQYPLANPHDQPAGSSLKREAAPWWVPSP